MSQLVILLELVHFKYYPLTFYHNWSFQLNQQLKFWRVSSANFFVLYLLFLWFINRKFNKVLIFSFSSIHSISPFHLCFIGESHHILHVFISSYLGNYHALEVEIVLAACNSIVYHVFHVDNLKMLYYGSVELHKVDVFNTFLFVIGNTLY